MKNLKVDPIRTGMLIREDGKLSMGILKVDGRVLDAEDVVVLEVHEVVEAGEVAVRILPFPFGVC